MSRAPRITTRKIIERVYVNGTMAERADAMNWLWDNGYRSVWSGPKPIGGHRFDVTRFRIIAEREVCGLEGK